LLDKYKFLINTISEIDGVLSIGKSGGENIPENNESDIDIFIFCNQVPDIQTRQAAVKKVAVSWMKISEAKGRFWGICDFATIDDTDICLMYFDISDMNDEIESVLNGSRPDRESEYFYPTGRCATFLSMHILCDKTGYISNMKEKLSVYPASLAENLYNHHIRKINDAEDFERAVARGDVLLYHFALELAIDHFLQALFALNRCYFPGRKRNMQYIESFKHKPENCSEKLLKVIKLGSEPDTLSKSYDLWVEICNELTEWFSIGF
jgi:hypothetical protein